MGESSENFTHVIKLGTVEDLSPKKVRDLAENNVYNGTKYVLKYCMRLSYAIIAFNINSLLKIEKGLKFNRSQ